MTDSGPPAQLDDVVTTGQRRSSPTMPFPARGSSSGIGDTPGRTIDLAGDDPEPPPGGDPCANPATALDWNADAAAAQTTKDLDEFAETEPPSGGRGFNEREYGAALWERADGSVIRGPMRHSDQTFAEAAAAAATGGTGRPTVSINWTPPEPGLVPIGSVHTHGVGGTLPSGHRGALESDVGHLLGIAAQREFLLGAGRGAEARIYVASRAFGQYETPGPIKIHVYNESNLDAAIGGEEGDEVNPNAQPCGAPA